MPDPTPEQTVGMSNLEYSSQSTVDLPGSRALAPERNRYVLKKFHARGGMGEVWIAEDAQLGREVCFKTLSSAGTHARERFLAEARITGQLEHPGVVPVHDVGVNDAGKPYYIMKFVRGGSLKKALAEYHAVLAKGDVSCEVERIRFLQIFVALCEVVAYAHSRGVLHRDLKPDNVMLGEYGETLVLDWGLAKLRGQTDGAVGMPSGLPPSGNGSAGSWTAAGSVMGSPLYMPPELADGRIADTDERTDVYLLGATLYEILTGRTPREGRSRDEILELARTAQPVSPRKIRKDIPKPLEAICLKAMASRKEDRYQNAMDIARDTQRCLAGEPVSAYRENAPERAWRWMRNHRRLLLRTAAAIIVTGAGLALAWKFRNISARATEAQRQSAELSSREELRTQIQQFDSLFGETRFYAASTDSGGERAPYYDMQNARRFGDAALAIVSRWGPELVQTSSSKERPRLQRQAYELLLLMAQEELATPQTVIDDKAASYLDMAQRLNPALSRGFHLLRSEEYRRRGDSQEANEAQRLADAPGTQRLAIDWFLQGEDNRKRSSDAADWFAVADAPGRHEDALHDAMDCYQKALQSDPQDYWSRFQLGRCYMSLGLCQQAVEAFGACIALQPSAPWGYSARGMAWGLLAQYDNAQADLNHALDLNPDFRPALLNRGVVHALQHQRSEATADFTAAMQPPEERRLIEAAYYRAQLSLDTGATSDAIADLTLVISERPGFSAAYMLRSQAEFIAGNDSLAMSDLNSLAASASTAHDVVEDAKLQGMRGHLLRLLAVRLPEGPAKRALGFALHDLEGAAAMSGPSSRVFTDLGAVRESLGLIDRAIDAYDQALRQDPEDIVARLDRGWARQVLHRYEPAAEDFRFVLHLKPSNAEAHAGLGYVLASQMQYEAARIEADQALLYGAGDYLLLHDIACIDAEISRTDPAQESMAQDAAIATLRRAVELWRRQSSGPDEIRLIEREPAFPTALRTRAEFAELLTSTRN